LLLPRRDRFDCSLFSHVDANDRPMLAICLGSQIANVQRGGRLIQHLDDHPRAEPVVHHLPAGQSAFHQVAIHSDSLLAEIVGSGSIEVNSRHHQAYDPGHIGQGLRPVAHAPDGLIEALEDSDRRFLVAVQWHPEDLADRPVHLALFRALIAASR
jgi:putative glutamine amidotransferase